MTVDQPIFINGGTYRAAKKWVDGRKSNFKNCNVTLSSLNERNVNWVGGWMGEKAIVRTDFVH